MKDKKIIRITTVPESFNTLLKGQLNYMNNFFNVIGVTSPGDVFNMVEKNEGVKLVPIKMTRIISPLSDLFALIKLYFLMIKEKPQIVHTHTPKAGILGMMAAFLARVPYRMHTVAGMPLLEYKGIKRFILECVEKMTYLCSTKVYPNSFVMKDIIINSNFCDKDKLNVIYNGSSNGIDLDYFSVNNISKLVKNDLKNNLNISDDDFIFCYIGRVVGDKGINELVEAFKNININFDNIKLIIVGNRENDLDPLMKNTNNEIRSNPNIVEIGYKQDVRPYLSISNLFVFPSYREGFPNVVLQACAMGVNALVSDINGCNEIVVNGVNGSLVPAKNVKALQEKMKYFLLNNQDNSDLLTKSRELIKSKYSRKVYWEYLKKEYMSFLDLDNVN
ncbi:MAG: glycosyltransferase family 1 protein [Candidatus Marinimicrobia bacterium]|nr:glycosyltransferase family 1 protein [Candidatus Neomarinimicrobiota bacterium]|tara:strand:+ start:6556 stop:7725 length:1170 start_codon:yes stop_codon:yes gene_type:complete